VAIPSLEMAKSLEALELPSVSEETMSQEKFFLSYEEDERNYILAINNEKIELLKALQIILIP